MDSSALRSEYISASAGSGKTYALSMRYCRLLMAGVAPERICALTFTRAATQEIFSAIIERLLEFRAKGEPRADEALQRLLDALPHLQIKTIDAFLAMIAKLFAYELEINPSFALYAEDEYPAGLVAKRDIVRKALQCNPSESVASLLDVLANLMPGRDDAGRFFGRLYRALEKQVGQLHDTAPEAWGNLEALGSPLRRAADRWAAYAVLQGVETKKTKVANAIARYPIDCDTPIAVKQSLDAGTPQFATWCNKLNFGALLEPTAEWGEEVVAAAKALYEDLYAMDVEAAAAHTRKLYRVLSRLAAAREAWSAESGLQTFTELTQRLAAKLGGKLAFDDPAALMVGYRMNAKLRHLMIDEFQDTSGDQWKSLASFASELRTGEDSTFFYVGDVKQSIYGWRGGDVSLFGQVCEAMALPAGEALTVSRRSAPEIIAMVNKTFVLAGADKEALPWQTSTVQAWQKGWIDHAAYKDNPHGFVRWVRAQGENKTEWMDALEAYIVQRVTTLRAQGKPLTMAVLSFTNSLYVPGNAFETDEIGLFARLRRRGIACALDGKRSLADSALGQWVVNLLKSIYEPQATLLREPIKHFKVPLVIPPFTNKSAPEWLDELFPAAVCEGLTAHDMEALNNVRRCLMRMEEQGERNPLRLAMALEETKVECRGDPNVLSLMTIHRSKGLTYDVVFTVVNGAILHHEIGEKALIKGVDWVLQTPEFKETKSFLPKFVEAEHKAQEARFSDTLCCLYVSLTRARYEQHIFAVQKELAKPTYRAYWIFRHEEETAGDEAWYTQCAALQAPKEAAPVEELPPWQCVEAALPPETELPGENAKASTVFELLDASHDVGRLQGTSFHARIARHTWGAFGDLFPEVFRQPEEPCTLWRERNFMVRLPDGRRLSGQFDRVHWFADRAVVYDFKTSAEAVATEAYRKQMTDYRAALAVLTGLPLAQIRATLLFTRTNTQVDVW